MKAFQQLKKWKNQVPTEGSDNLKKDGIIREYNGQKLDEKQVEEIVPKIKEPVKEKIEKKQMKQMNKNNFLEEFRTDVKRSQRNIQLATKLTKEDHEFLTQLAYEKRMKIVEVLEASFEALKEKLGINS
jgi:hypothetical protein